MHPRLLLLTAIFLTASSNGQATMPLIDSIKYEGKWHQVTAEKSTWIPLKDSEALRDLYLQLGRRFCSALGGPKGNWKIEDNKLWLSSLFSCGGVTHSIEPIYGGEGNAVHAEWVSDTLVIRSGQPLCIASYGPGIREKDILISIDHGNVVNVTERDNKNHPAVPRVAYITYKLTTQDTQHQQPMSRSSAEAIAKQLVDKGSWHCLNDKEQELQQNLPTIVDLRPAEPPPASKGKRR